MQALGGRFAHAGNIEKAKNLYRNIASGGSLKALVNIADLYDPRSAELPAIKEASGIDYLPDPSQAYAWYRLAHMRGDPQSIGDLIGLGRMLSDSARTQAEFEALALFQELQDERIILMGQAFVNEAPPGMGPKGQPGFY